MKYAHAVLWVFFGWMLRKLHLPKRWVHEAEDRASMRMFDCSLDFSAVSWSSDFYEEDEPLEKVLAGFERSEKVYTAPPGSRIVGWRCSHFSMTTGGAASLPTRPTTSLCACQLRPVFN